MNAEIINAATDQVKSLYVSLEETKEDINQQIEEVLELFSEQDAALESDNIRKAIKATAKAFAINKMIEFDEKREAVNQVREVQGDAVGQMKLPIE